MNLALILAAFFTSQAEAQTPNLIVQSSGTAISYVQDDNCFSAQDDQKAEQLAETNATDQCMAKNGGIAVQYTAYSLSHESTENPRPYGFICTTVAEASFVCDPEN